MTHTTSFHQKNDWYWWQDHSWHHNDQYWSFIVEWISENTIFHWYLVPSLSEAVEASPCHFFQNCLMKLKCPHLLKPLYTIIQENHLPFYPSKLFIITRFNMRHPVSRKITATSKNFCPYCAVLQLAGDLLTDFTCTCSCIGLALGFWVAHVPHIRLLSKNIHKMERWSSRYIRDIFWTHIINSKDVRLFLNRLIF